MDQHLGSGIEKGGPNLYQQLALYEAINSDAPPELRRCRSHSAQRYLSSADQVLYLHSPGDVIRISKYADFKTVAE